MEYGKFDDTVVVRIDKGEEVVGSLLAVCEKEGISLAQASAIGAVGSIEIRMFDTAKKEYRARFFEGGYEIVSLSGSITQMDGKPYAHLHIAAGDMQGGMVGGHLGSAVVSATCEVFLRVIKGVVARKPDEATGLNLMRFQG